MYKIFVINPGSTSTKLALFEDDRKLLEECIKHDAEKLMSYKTINDQLPYRAQIVADFIRDNNIDLTGVDAIVGRGGCVKPIEGGVYEVNDKLMEDTINSVGGVYHPSSLGIQLGAALQERYGGRLFMVDPICVDELCDEARITGVKGIRRKAVSHALNIRGTAKLHCEKYGLDYQQANLIVCNLDGGISIAAHRKGKQIDCNNACGGDGPFTPTRTGSLALTDALDYMEKGHSVYEMRKLCAGAGGFISYFDTNDGDEIKKMIEDGDEEAVMVWRAFLYNIVKSVGSMATVLEGKVDGILLTGRYVRFRDLLEYIDSHCGWIAPIYIYPNEVEHEAMARGALEVLEGKVKPLEYK